MKKYFKVKGGTSSGKELMKWYKGQGSIETLMGKAFQIITTHKLPTKL